MELISIIVPSYNCEQYINRCLDSLVNQTYKNIEIILVDDGSNDNSLEIFKLYSNRDKRIKVFTKENGGASAARNYGIDRANGDYLLFIDIDDYIELDMVEKMSAEIQKSDDCIVFSNNDEILSDRIEYRRLFCDIEDKNKLSKVDVMRDIASGKAGLVCCKLIPKSIVDKYSIKFDESIQMCEDQIFFLTVCQYINNFFHIDEYLYHYDRRNDNSITLKYQDNAYENQIYVFNKIENIFKNNKFNSNHDIEILANRIKNSLWFCINNEIQSRQNANIFSRCNKASSILLYSDIDKKYREYIKNSYIGKILIKGISSKNPTLISYIFAFIIKVLIPVKNFMRVKLRRTNEKIKVYK